MRVWFIGAIIGFFLLSGCDFFVGRSERDDGSPSDLPRNTRNWALVWSDEFNDDGPPDPSKWGYEVGFVRNEELQYYTDHRVENARVENGNLVIEARKEAYRNAEYTSASLTTSGKKEFLYGRIEIRAMLPTGTGMWAAVFGIGSNIDNVGWPACGEIDIVENVGYDAETVHANVHTKAFNWVAGNNKGADLEVVEPYGRFHVYAVEWYRNRIDFFVDDTKYFTYAKQGRGADAWPFDKAQYLIVNAAVGGTWGGKNGVDDTIFPQKFYIDYVRAYRNAR